MISAIRTGWNKRSAWWFTASCRTRERFARTVLGSYWIGVSNLITVSILTLVYSRVFNVGSIREYVLYLGIGLTLWNALSSSIVSSASLVDLHSHNIRNTNIHPIFYCLEEWAFQLQSLAQSLVVIIAFLTVIKPNTLINFSIYAILPLANLCIALFWISTIIFCASAKFEDLKQLLPIAMQTLFLVTPVVYNKSQLGSLGWIASINPIYIIIEGVRVGALEARIDLSTNLWLLAMNVIGCVFALIILTKLRDELPFLA